MFASTTLAPAKQGHVVAALLPRTIFVSATVWLRAWQNESTFGKHDHANSVAGPNLFKYLFTMSVDQRLANLQ